MTIRTPKWLLAIVLSVFLTAAGLGVAAFVLAGRIEPLARQETVQYLSEHFDSDVQIQALHLRVPEVSPVRLLLTRRWGATAQIEGEGLSLQKKGSAGAAPLVSIRKFSIDVDLDSLLHPPILVSHVSVDGMEIQIPPHGERRPSATSARPTSEKATFPSLGAIRKLAVVIQRVDIQNAGLVLLPRDPQKLPLQFEIQNLQLESIGADGQMSYDASLTNAKPPGKILATGTFGPWHSDDPGDTPIAGDYLFQDADLGVFNAIAGTLRSSGHFEGQLSALTVRGQASVPNFRLRRVGNPAPLTARFEVLVDATDGNTTLQPVVATLGSSNFTTRGGIIKHEANQPRAIRLDVDMPDGNLRDVLLLTMKQAPFMAGRLSLQTKIDIPPLVGKVLGKLILDGHFQVLEGKLQHSTMQAQLAGLSQGAPRHAGNVDADAAIASVTGDFHLEDALIHFSQLSFGIPGANLNMDGNYNLESDAIDFTGTVKLQPTLSQAVTGWKRQLLRPVDRLLEKENARTSLHIRVTGTSNSPKFGLVLNRQ
jgi:AsmA-like C-terminal region